MLSYALTLTLLTLLSSFTSITASPLPAPTSISSLIANPPSQQTHGRTRLVKRDAAPVTEPIACSGKCKRLLKRSASPEPSPSAAPSPSPNFLSGLWNKIKGIGKSVVDKVKSVVGKGKKEKSHIIGEAGPGRMIDGTGPVPNLKHPIKY